MEFVARGVEAMIFRDLRTRDIYRIYPIPRSTLPPSYIHTLVSPIPFFLRLKESRKCLVHPVHQVEALLGEGWKWCEETSGELRFVWTEESNSPHPPLVYHPPRFPSLEEPLQPLTVHFEDPEGIETQVLQPDIRIVEVLEPCVATLKDPGWTLFQKRSILAQVCVGLAEAQDRYGFVHNDLHPGNVLLTPSTRTSFVWDRYTIPILGYEARIADFGLAEIHRPQHVVSPELHNTYKRPKSRERYNLYPGKAFDPGYDIIYLLLLVFLHQPGPWTAEVDRFLREHGVTWHPKTYRPSQVILRHNKY